MDVLIIGAGSMAVHYATVLRHLGKDFSCCGRSLITAKKFNDITGVAPTTGSLYEQLEARNLGNTLAIVAVDIIELLPVCQILIDKSCRRILVEKPGALDIAQMQLLSTLDKKKSIRVAYNRRFLSSTLRAFEMIKEDEGIQTMGFEFTEFPDKVDELAIHPPEVLSNFAFANSSHVFDLAFFLANSKNDLSDVTIAASLQRGNLAWRNTSARYVSCGSIGHDRLFHCAADWKSAGGWGVEITTAKRKLKLMPLERLTEQKINSFSTMEVNICTKEVNSDLKPGLLGLVKNMLLEDGDRLPTIAEQTSRMKVFAKIIGR